MRWSRRPARRVRRATTGTSPGEAQRRLDLRPARAAVPRQPVRGGQRLRRDVRGRGRHAGPGLAGACAGRRTGVCRGPAQQSDGRLRARRHGDAEPERLPDGGAAAGPVHGEQARCSRPARLAISPDGKNVYVADAAENKGRIDVLARNPPLARCQSRLRAGKPAAAHAEVRRRREEEEHESPPPPSGCTEVPGLASVDAIAVTGDGSMVYAIGRESAVVFSRDASSGALTEVACSAEQRQPLCELPLAQRSRRHRRQPRRPLALRRLARTRRCSPSALGLAVASASTSADAAGIARVRGALSARDAPTTAPDGWQLTRAVRRREGAARGRGASGREGRGRSSCAPARRP